MRGEASDVDISESFFRLRKSVKKISPAPFLIVSFHSNRLCTIYSFTVVKQIPHTYILVTVFFINEVIPVGSYWYIHQTLDYLLHHLDGSLWRWLRMTPILLDTNFLEQNSGILNWTYMHGGVWRLLYPHLSLFSAVVDSSWCVCHSLLRCNDLWYTSSVVFSIITISRAQLPIGGFLWAIITVINVFVLEHYQQI